MGVRSHSGIMGSAAAESRDARRARTAAAAERRAREAAGAVAGAPTAGAPFALCDRALSFLLSRWMCC